MKKYVLLALIAVLFLLIPETALGEDIFAKEYRVFNCESYITLRDEPSTKATALDRIPLGTVVVAFEEAENGFLYVHYNNQQGYALKKYLAEVPAAYSVPVSLTDGQMRELNLFLSNFTESDLTYFSHGVFDIQTASENALVEFALEHTWYNYQGSRIEWGEYKNGNNVRMRDDQVRSIVTKYFGVYIHNLEPLYADYEAPYYYWAETGGHIPFGFALTESVSYLGGNRYLVSFTSFGNGDMWNNDDLSLSFEEARAKFPYSGESRGVAVIYAENIFDRNTYKLTRLIME